MLVKRAAASLTCSTDNAASISRRLLGENKNFAHILAYVDTNKQYRTTYFVGLILLD